jgi:hypothetical protein
MRSCQYTIGGCPCDCFNPTERAPGTHWIGGWVGPRAGLDTVAKQKIPSPCRDSNPQLNTALFKNRTELDKPH